MSVRDVVRASEESKDTPDISTYVIHCMRTGKSFPGIDKLLILGKILNVDARDFLQPRTTKEISGFLQLDFTEKCIRASISKGKGNKQKISK